MRREIASSTAGADISLIRSQLVHIDKAAINSHLECYNRAREKATRWHR